MPLHEAQEAFCQSSALYRGFVGGRGAGKSWVGAFDLICRAREGRTYLIGSPTGVLMQDTTYPTFKKLAQDLGVWWDVKLSPYPNVTIAPGAVVRFRTAEDPERMRGPNLSGVWLDEASLMPEGAYNVSIAALREGGEQGWLSATFTPKGLGHWTYSVFGKHRPDTFLVHSPTRENPFLPPDFAHTLAGQYSPMRQRQELGGEFVSLEGAEWPPEYFPPSIWSDAWPTQFTASALALDPALGHGERGKPPAASREPAPGCYAAFVFVGLGLDRNLWVDCWLDRHWTATDLTTQAINLVRRYRPGGFSIECNGGQEFLAELMRQEFKARTVDLPLYGITNFEDKDVRIRSKLTPFLAQGRFRFRKGSPGAQLLVQQMRDFPVGADKDGPDALQMALQLLDNLLGQKTGGAQPKAYR